jgi:heptosyltransferase-2
MYFANFIYSPKFLNINYAKICIDARMGIIFNTMKILIVQTAFIGDVVLATPLIEACKIKYSEAEISFLTIPYSAPILRNHPMLKEVLVFDKRGTGNLRNSWGVMKLLREKQFDLAIVPHRSLRSAVILYLANIPQRIGFDRSAGKFLFTKIVKYHKDWTEIERDLSLMGLESQDIPPKIYPSEKEKSAVDEFLSQNRIADFIAIAPGSIWNTKRWPEAYYRELCELMQKKGFPPAILIGSKADYPVCFNVAQGLEGYIYISAGELGPLESAELLRRAKLLIANDSAAGHIASAVGTKVVSIFGPTVPAFGFAPYGEGNIIIEHPDLYCRPCRIHGSKKCPEKHFRCMLEVTPEDVVRHLTLDT